MTVSRGDELAEYPANPSLTCREIKTTPARTPHGSTATISSARVPRMRMCSYFTDAGSILNVDPTPVPTITYPAYNIKE